MQILRMVQTVQNERIGTAEQDRKAIEAPPAPKQPFA
jgi:hypothetical protein